MPLTNRFADLLPEITEWRRDIHTHPELQFDVHRTAGIVADKLREFGVDEVVEGIGRTGVVGIIKGKTPDTDAVIGLRADMDALPILEASGVELPHKRKAACTPADTTAIQRCCWVQQSISVRPETSAVRLR